MAASAAQISPRRGAAACDVLVLGAGVVGAATAYALARRGLRVAIADKAEGPGRGCSFANGAQLSYAYADALASPALLRKMPKLAMGLAPAFRIRLGLDPELLRWGLSFLRNCKAGAFERSTLAGLQLGLESRLALHALLERHPLDFAYRVSGKLHLQHDRAGMAAAAASVAFKRAQGFDQQLIGADEARRIEPAVAGASELAGAIWTPDEEVGDPQLFATALLHRLLAAARAALPEAADYEAASGGGAGLRPMTPSSLPIVRRAGERLYVNVGHG